MRRIGLVILVGIVTAMKARRLASMKRSIAVVAIAVMVLLVGAGTVPSGASGEHRAPVFGADRPGVIMDRYIVVFEEEAAGERVRAARDDAVSRGASIHFEYGAALKGFAATLTPEALDRLRNNADVDYLDADAVVSVSHVQSPVTWGLDRIDQRSLPLTNAYAYEQTGGSVTAYVIDTGIRFSHAEFGGRAVSGPDFIDGGSADDCNGHGTHVAGILGGRTYGVAKSVALIGVRVLDCNGSGANSQVIAGVDWVTGNHTAGQPAVANMSLGGGATTSLDNAVVNSINDGVTYAIAAGNENTNACNRSPARVPAAVTVGSTNKSDVRSPFSNYGSCLDIFAPGSGITSAWRSSDSATNTISGTSMATPHVAGVAAQYLEANPAASPQAVRDALVNSATPGVVTLPGNGSPNRLLYSVFGAAAACGPLPEQFEGTLSGTGDADVQPNGASFTSAGGIHSGCLDGSPGTDFDLYLYRFNGLFYSVVAKSIGSASHEEVIYGGAAGTYYWRIVSFSGSGSYTFGMQRP